MNDQYDVNLLRHASNTGGLRRRAVGEPVSRPRAPGTSGAMLRAHRRSAWDTLSTSFHAGYAAVSCT